MNDVKVSIDPPSSPPPKPASASVDAVVTDAKGRRITIREPDLLQESRLIRALGDAAGNVNYVMLYAMPAAMAVKIDDIDMTFPTNQLQVDASIKALGREGMAAVMEHITATAKQKESEEAIKK